MAKRKSGEKKENTGIVSSAYEAVSVLISSVIIIVFLFAFGYRFLGVSGESMVPTLNDGDWIFVSQYQMIYEPSYGDVVVISQPNVFHENIVKRVIATEGQTVDINYNTGNVLVDGNKLNEPYINNLTTLIGDVPFPMTVPKGYVFVMGDNRQHSTDSRKKIIGNIRKEYILGRVEFKISKKDGFKIIEKINVGDTGG